MSINRKVTSEVVNNIFAKIKIYYGPNFNSHYKTDEEVMAAVLVWQEELAKFDYMVVMQAVKICFATYIDYPPTLPQLIDLCFSCDGLPSLEESLRLAIKNEITHPVVLELRNKIGSWALKNDYERTLHDKATKVYPSIVSSFKSDPMRFKQDMKNHQLQIEDKKPAITEQKEVKIAPKIEVKKVNHPEWDKDKIDIHGRLFDLKVFNERKNYLISLNEFEASTLKMEDYYDRCRHMSEIEAAKIVRIDIPKNDKKVIDFDERRERKYKDWISD